MTTDIKECPYFTGVSTEPPYAHECTYYGKICEDFRSTCGYNSTGLNNWLFWLEVFMWEKLNWWLGFKVIHKLKSWLTKKGIK